MLSLLDTAKAVAIAAHAGQKRRTGEAYVSHPAAVAAILQEFGASEESIVTAWLHDVLEDTDYTVQDLQDAGIPQSCIENLLILTHKKSESYESYIERICKAKFNVRQVKVADIVHNLSSQPKPERVKLYCAALIKLSTFRPEWFNEKS